MKAIQIAEGSGELRYNCAGCGEIYEGTVFGDAMINVDEAYQNCDTYVTMNELYEYQVDIFKCEYCGYMSEDEDDFPEVEDEGIWMCGECENRYEEKKEAMECCSHMMASA